ncbi:transposase [endosymbiont of Acanthamoeba sp. UWC8]|uniref:transposase n=1 Tax=endosymbiont of Acanthamoeba sp. UWC8 TaxID=86106 RepID=UPI0004D132B2|nr:transposase [endosymbiont of Acanthamoeba sp. UWC8]
MPSNPYSLDLRYKTIRYLGKSRGLVVIMDNISFYKPQRSDQLIKSVCFKLPPHYSPNLNSVEKFWANMEQ